MHPSVPLMLSLAIGAGSAQPPPVAIKAARLIDGRGERATGPAVVVANDMGSVTSATATLGVDSGEVAAEIVSITPGQTVDAGTTVVLAVVASGTEPLSYQWAFDGALLEGATSSQLVLEAVQPAQAGTYTVSVSNPRSLISDALLRGLDATVRAYLAALRSQ